MAINIELFGKDHWSLFAYLETRCVDKNGTVDIIHLRCRSKKGWEPTYGTRLQGYFEDKGNPDLYLCGYDDFDCIDDLEAAGLIKNNGTGHQPVIELTSYGWVVASSLRKHKADGGMFADFRHRPSRGLKLIAPEKTPSQDAP